MCNRYSIEKDKAVFIDDNFRNIEAAKDFGLLSIHFSNANQLKSELNSLNIFLD
jgi:2-haloacid dehalogenase